MSVEKLRIVASMRLSPSLMDVHAVRRALARLTP
jgi:hypothetical protein